MLSQLHRRRQRPLLDRNRGSMASCRFFTLCRWRNHRRRRVSFETRQALRCAKAESRLDSAGCNSHRRLRRSGRVPRLYRRTGEVCGSRAFAQDQCFQRSTLRPFVRWSLCFARNVHATQSFRLLHSEQPVDLVEQSMHSARSERISGEEGSSRRGCDIHQQDPIVDPLSGRFRAEPTAMGQRTPGPLRGQETDRQRSENGRQPPRAVRYGEGLQAAAHDFHVRV